ncbi:MAG: hypothetical protein R6U54_02775 [Candidatus Omnitrophota bacterium]
MEKKGMKEVLKKLKERIDKKLQEKSKNCGCGCNKDKSDKC